MSVPAFLFSMIVYPNGFSTKSQEFSYGSMGGVVLLFWIWSIFGSGSKLGNDSGLILVDLGPSWFSMLVTVFAFWSSMRGYICELFWQAQGVEKFHKGLLGSFYIIGTDLGLEMVQLCIGKNPGLVLFQLISVQIWSCYGKSWSQLVFHVGVYPQGCEFLQRSVGGRT